jgi:hypothetical protein
MIEANDDRDTRSAYAYRMKYVRSRLARMGFTVKTLQGLNATREKVVAELARKRQKVVYLTGSGHGNAHAFRGYDGRFIFQVGSYQDAESRERGAHFLSCSTALELGPDFVSNQCKAYFGYSVPFAWDDDRNAESFFLCDSEIDLALARGASAGEALRRARARFDKEIRKQNLVAGNTASAAILQTLRDHLCGPSEKSRQYGDPDWRL